MFRKTKKKLVSNREVYNMVQETAKIKKPWKQIVRAWRLGKILCSKKYYQFSREIDEIKKAGYIMKFTHDNVPVSLYLPLLQSDDIQKNIVIHRDFFEADELELLRKKYIPQEARILDIGANIGNHTVYYGKICLAKQVYSFEPMKETFAMLKKNIAINNLSDKVKTYCVALGGVAGKGTANNFDGNNTGYTQVEMAENGEIEIVALDAYNLNDIDFIKIDVEGFEYNVLLGAKETLERNKAVIFIEIFENNKDKVNKLLNEYGYYDIGEEELGQTNYIYVKR